MMTLRLVFLLPMLLASLVLAGCDTLRGPAPAQAVYATSGALNATLATVDLYGKLPLCKPGAPALCHEVGVLERASSVGKVTGTLIDEAEKLALDPRLKSTDGPTQAQAAADASLKALQAITSTMRLR